jgi:hypothetical protein
VGAQQQEYGNKQRRAKTFADLLVWQEAHQLTLGVYRVTPAL